MTQLEKDIVYSYTEDKLTMKEIQDKYSIGYKKVRNTLDKYQISRRPKKGSINIKNRRILTEDEEKLVCETYIRTNQVAECRKIIHSSQDIIRRCLQKYNLYKTHKESIQNNPQNQRKYLVNDNYFNGENSNMAYLLGFIAADGCVRKDTNELKISLAAIDKDFLEMVKEEIGGRDLKYYTTNTGYDVVSWSCTSKQIKEDLLKYNITPNKTFTFTFPKNLNKKYWIDFIRGYFDGDGSVSTAGPNAIRWQLCSATKDVLNTVVKFFEDEYNIPSVSILEQKRKNKIYYIQYSSVSSRKIYDILYPKDCLYLKRKKDKFEEIYFKNLKI